MDRPDERVEEPASLGENEREVLRFITERAPVAAGTVVEAFSEERRWARTTVLTVIERLRKKGYLTRRRRQGVYHYSPRFSHSEVLQGLVHRFVETTLDGSLAPMVEYLTRTRRLSAQELAELEQLVEAMRSEQREGGHE